MAIAYKAVQLAEVCYIFEATHWLAFGRLPEFIPGENGHEVRLSSIEHEDSFEPLVDSTVFLELGEIEYFLPDVDQSKYWEAQTENFGGTPEQIIKECEDFLSRFSNRADTKLEAHLTEHEKIVANRAELVRWLLPEKKPIDRLVDQARAKIFLALSDGSLKAEGYFSKVEEDQDFQICEAIEIPAEAWSWDGLDWDLASTMVGQNEVRAAYVSTDALLSLFPPSKVEGKPLTGKIVADTFIPESSSGPSTVASGPKGRRGRPNLGNGMVEKALCNEYLRKLRAGELSDKREANIQLMIDWAKEILGESVGRTSVQRWLQKIEPSAQK